MVATSSQDSIANTNRHPAIGVALGGNINFNGKDFMLQILIVAHIVVFELATEFGFQGDNRKNERLLLKLCEGALLICFVASMFTCVNF